jgi:hypothetical protein
VQDTVAPGIEVLAGLNIKEGLDILLDTVMGPGKWGFKQKMLYKALPLYGGNAKPYIAKSKDTKLWQDLIKPIEADTNPPKLISVEEAKRAAMAP